MATRVVRTYLAFAFLNTPPDTGSPDAVLGEAVTRLNVGDDIQIPGDGEIWVDAMISIVAEDSDTPFLHVVVRTVLGHEADSSEAQLEMEAREKALRPAYQKAIDEMRHLLTAVGVDPPDVTLEDIIEAGGGTE